MSKLLKLLKDKKLTLIVELPENRVELAQEAEREGADALLVRQDYAPEEVLGAVKIPVGVDLSHLEKLSDKEIKSYEKFDFINFHFEVLPVLAKQKRSGRIIALNEHYTLDRLIGLENLGAQAVDAAIVPISQAARELVVGDLQNYIAIAISSNLPVIIPTQRKVLPSEVAIIADTGAKGLLLTHNVLGENLKKLKEYRAAVDDLGE
jgi:hypothetical protein